MASMHCRDDASGVCGGWLNECWWVVNEGWWVVYEVWMTWLP
jgi:hypothetical protein